MKKTITIILSAIIAVLAVALLCAFMWNSKVQRKLRVAEHNVAAALDSIRYLKDANGKLYAEKSSYIATVRELEELNKEMFDNIKSLKKKVSSGANIGVVVRDTIFRDNIIEYSMDSLVNIPFADETINANSLVRIHRDNVQLQQFTYEVDIPLEVYFTKDYQVIARSKNENVKFNKLDSFIDPVVTKNRKPKRWGLGVQAGIGATACYDFRKQNFSLGVGPYVGIGISYQFLQW